MNDEMFTVFGAVNDLNERLKRVEKQVPDYNADLIEIGRTVGLLHAKIAELEKEIARLNKEGV